MVRKIFLFTLLGVVLIGNSCKKKGIFVDKDYTKNVGESANYLLSDNKFKELKIEILYMDGFKPQTASINNLKAFLEQRLNKPNGISFSYKQIPNGSGVYSMDEIRAIEDEHRSLFNKSKVLTASLMFVNGHYNQDSGNSTVLGVAYRNSSMVIFEETIHGYSDGGLGEPSREILESTVILHEFGHIMGLVNVGTAMVHNHQDTDHGHHCDNDDCLMYWTAETGGVIANLAGMSSVPGLDANCIEDLQNNGGK